MTTPLEYPDTNSLSYARKLLEHGISLSTRQVALHAGVTTTTALRRLAAAGVTPYSQRIGRHPTCWHAADVLRVFGPIPEVKPCT